MARIHADRPLLIAILGGQCRMRAWKRRLLEALSNDSRFEVIADILDGRIDPERHSPPVSLVRQKLWRLCKRLDERRAEKQGATTATLAPLADQQNRPVHVVCPRREAELDHFDDNDSSAIASLGADLLLQLGFARPAGKILSAARYGIWSLGFPSEHDSVGEYAGYWEAVTKASQTTAELRVLSSRYPNSFCAARCAQSTMANAVANAEAIADLAVSLVIRELAKVARTGALPSELPPEPPQDVRSAAAPSTPQILRYGLRRAADATKNAAIKARWRAGRCPGRWRLAIGHGKPSQEMLAHIRESLPNPGTFWADPFLIEHKGDVYVFFEEYDYGSRRGWIAAGRIVDNSIEYLGKAIDDGVHMSFPFVFEHHGQIFMLPEVSARKRIELWRATRFPLEWKLEKTALEGLSIADPVLFEDGAQCWLAANVSRTTTPNHCNELHLFSVDSPMLQRIEPHPDNPVIIDSRTARNGGRPFINEGRIYRPAQCNVGGVYGAALTICEITALSMDRYAERPAISLTPSFRPGLNGLHHVDVLNDLFVIDYRTV